MIALELNHVNADKTLRSIIFVVWSSPLQCVADTREIGIKKISSSVYRDYLSRFG